jgi:Putative abortive phage resistance protein AbiGi, antitoxin
MGYLGHDDWRDMSDYVLHFTRPLKREEMDPPPDPPAEEGKLTRQELWAENHHRQQRDPTGFSFWKSILGEAALRPGTEPFGAGRKVPRVGDRHRCVCFSEIPLDMLKRLIDRRDCHYGIGFLKNFIVKRGGAPVWYLDKDGRQGRMLARLIRKKREERIDLRDPVWKLTPFIDLPGEYPRGSYRFEWEREWRVVGEVPFSPDDLAFLFLPEREHDEARQFFADVELEHTGPAYHECVYIDPEWKMDRIQQALKTVPRPPPPSPDARPWWM